MIFARARSVVLALTLLFATLAHAERLTSVDVHAVLAAFKIANQKDLSPADCAHLLTENWFIANASFGTSQTTAEVINQFLPEVKGGDELIRIFKLASSDPYAFRPALDRWLLKKGQIKTMTLTELRDYLKADPKIDFPIFNSPEDEAKGFISHKAYTYAFGHGLFPIGDPHDLFFHIPSYLDPRFAGALKRIAQLIFETAEQKKYSALFDYLTGPMREVGVENWSYLFLDSKQKPRLFLQGNQPFFALNQVAERMPRVRDPILPFVNITGATSIRDFNKLPRWEEFAAQSEPKRILRALGPILTKLELSSGTADYANRRLRGKQNFTRSMTIAVFLNSLARFADRDPMLRSLFSNEARGEAAVQLLDLIDLYWRWIQSA